LTASLSIGSGFALALGWGLGSTFECPKCVGDLEKMDEKELVSWNLEDDCFFHFGGFYGM